MLLAISFLVYGGLELAPGDAVSHMISPELALSITAEQLDAMREAYGLNKSFLTTFYSQKRCFMVIFKPKTFLLIQSINKGRRASFGQLGRGV